jgi:hypothetical protein
MTPALAAALARADAAEPARVTPANAVIPPRVSRTRRKTRVRDGVSWTLDEHDAPTDGDGR